MSNSAKIRAWAKGANMADQCKGCGHELLSKDERAGGLCEDCGKAQFGDPDAKPAKPESDQGPRYSSYGPRYALE